MTQPDPHDATALSGCILARMGDLAGYMRRHGLDAHMATGPTANGLPCTVIVAVGWTAETAAEIGRKMVERVAEHRKQLAENAERQGPA